MSHKVSDSGGSSGGSRPRFREVQPSDSEDSDSDSHSSESPESGSEDEKSSPVKRAIIGPVIPPALHNMSTSDTEKTAVSPGSADSGEEGDYGPALPPSFAPGAPSVIGPAMPPGFKPGQSQEMEEEDSDVIGPVPHSGGQSQHSSSAAADFERRAQAMKNKLNNPNGSDGAVQRETWMLELPEKMKVGMGLQARTFKTRDTSQVDAAWTETPADKERRLKEGRKRPHEDTYIPTQRDKEMEEQVEILNAKRQKSLYELHQEKVHGTSGGTSGGSASKKEKKNKDKKKRKEKKTKEKKKEKKKKEKEKKKKEDKKQERRPFDRDLDLKVNQFDDAMRKRYVKSAQGLGNNFGHSERGKYL